MPFCLVPKLADKFKQAIVSGEINPDKLHDMKPKERHEFFASLLGEENAAPVNALFEEKLLLKNWQQGVITAARKLLGDSPQAQRDLISRVQKMTRILSPAEESQFMEDFVSKKLGTQVTFEEAKKISQLTEAMEKARDVKDGGGDRMEYGRARVALKNYLDDLKLKADKFSMAEFKTNPGKGLAKLGTEIAGNTKAIQASLDDSAIFRQGWKTLWTHPGIWAKNSLDSIRNIIKTFGKDEVLNELNADIVSRPNYDLMQKAKLDIGTAEEAYPTALPEKIPGFGRVYKATENAYTAFVRKTRADVFDKYIDIAQKTGVDLTDKELLSIGKMVNSLTGRGSLGKLDAVSKEINSVFFSPKMLKSQFDVLLQPITGAGGSSFVRKQAAINLLKIISGTAAVLGVAKAVKPDSVEIDPRSANFGKIRVKDTRFDVTGGMDSVITLAARLMTMSSKSSTTNKVSKLNAKDKKGDPAFGATTGEDVVVDFLGNKLSPVGNVIKDLLKDQTFDGKKPSLANEGLSLITPLPVKTFQELKNNPNSANILVGMIADALGISVNTYSSKPIVKAFTERANPAEPITDFHPDYQYPAMRDPQEGPNAPVKFLEPGTLAYQLAERDRKGLNGPAKVAPLTLQETQAQTRTRVNSDFRGRGTFGTKPTVLTDIPSKKKPSKINNQFDDIPRYYPHQI